MRHAKIKIWLDHRKLFPWLQNSPDENVFKRRLVIWLSSTNKTNAHKIAAALGISKQAVWLWIHQYNVYGPEGLNRQGRGGRRWGFLTIEEEDKILKPFIEKIISGQSVKPAFIKEIIEKRLNSKVSMPYVYRLLKRHNWFGIINQSLLPTKQSTIPNTDFTKITRPWLRKA